MRARAHPATHPPTLTSGPHYLSYLPHPWTPLPTTPAPITSLHRLPLNNVTPSTTNPHRCTLADPQTHTSRHARASEQGAARVGWGHCRRTLSRRRPCGSGSEGGWWRPAIRHASVCSIATPPPCAAPLVPSPSHPRADSRLRIWAPPARQCRLPRRLPPARRRRPPPARVLQHGGAWAMWTLLRVLLIGRRWCRRLRARSVARRRLCRLRSATIAVKRTQGRQTAAMEMAGRPGPATSWTS